MQSTLYNIENILVKQKDLILFQINMGRIEAAAKMLHVVSDLWDLADYKYKRLELEQRIKQEASK